MLAVFVLCEHCLSIVCLSEYCLIVMLLCVGVLCGYVVVLFTLYPSDEANALFLARMVFPRGPTLLSLVKERMWEGTGIVDGCWELKRCVSPPPPMG